MHHPASGISFPGNFVYLLIMNTYHSYLISHMSVCHFLHHHCHHPLLLLSSTPDSKLIFSTNLFLRSSSTFPPTRLTPRTPAVFVFLVHVGFNFGISQLPKLCVKISILMHRRMWVHSFSTRLTSVTFTEDKVLIFLILHKNAKIVQL